MRNVCLIVTICTVSNDELVIVVKTARFDLSVPAAAEASCLVISCV